MERFRSRIAGLGRRHRIRGNEVDVLRHLRTEKRMSQREIADALGCSVPTVRYHLGAAGLLKRRDRFVDMLRKRGYSSVAAFFIDSRNTHRTLKEIATDLGLCYPTVSKYYHEFRREKESISY